MACLFYSDPLAFFYKINRFPIKGLSDLLLEDFFSWILKTVFPTEDNWWTIKIGWEGET